MKKKKLKRRRRQWFPSVDEFKEFLRKEILPLGFKYITEKRFTELLRERIVFKPHAKEGQELGLELVLNDRHIFIWLSFLWKEKKFREKDAVWVITVQDKKLVHPAPEIRRTKGKKSNWLHRMKSYAKEHVERAIGATMCIQCHQFLRVTWPYIKQVYNPETNVKELRNIGARYETCTSKTIHRSKRPVLDVDHALSEESLKFIKPIRKERARGRKKANLKGKIFGIKRLERSQRNKKSA